VSRVPPVVWAAVLVVVVVVIAIAFGALDAPAPQPSCSPTSGTSSTPALCASPTPTG
jgi:hypothetical protein